MAADSLSSDRSSIGCFLSRDQEICFRGSLFLTERTPQLRKRNILQLPDALPGDTEILTNILQVFGFPPSKPNAQR